MATKDIADRPTHVWISDITIPEGRRKIDDEAVKRLAESIEQIGLIHPITVVRKRGTGTTATKSGKYIRSEYILVAGLHRIEAYKRTRQG
jgi:ParB-like chromosome segregation protein Spo0J